MDRRKDPRRYIIGADSSTDSVVVQVDLRDELVVHFVACILDHIAWPSPPTAWCIEGLRSVSPASAKTWYGAFVTSGSTVPTGGAEPLWVAK